MRCWILTVGEPLPIDGSEERRLRSGILASMLADAGHDVTWWTSSFDHWRKTHLTDGHASVRVSPGLRLMLLWGRGYRRNISVERVRDHRDVAAAFERLAPLAPAPDVILASLPTLELSAAAARFAQARRIPVIVDVRDMWPDVMERSAPSWLRPVAPLALRGMRRLARQACRGASAITGHTQAFVDWGLRHANRSPSAWDRDFPFGYESRRALGTDDLDRSRSFWNERGVHADADQLTVCFAGTVGHGFDFAPVLSAADALALDGVRFIICGTGDTVEELREAATRLPNATLPGWVTAPQLHALLAMSDIGLAPYRDEVDFRVTIPNKAPEYWSAGLPIATALPSGDLVNLLHDNDCGFSYAGSAGQLAGGLRRLRDDRATLSRMKAAARRLYDERFRADVVYGGMVRYIEDVARERPRVAVT